LKSNLLSKSESNLIIKEISECWKMDLPKTKNLKSHQILDDAQLIIGEGFIALKVKKDFLPFLSQTEILVKFPNVMVDMGAVRFMCDGANVMRPGIKNFTEFEKDQIVCVIEESQHRFLAVVGEPVIYTLDPLGSVLPDEYAAVGTGAEMALGVLDPQFKENMSEQEAIDLAIKAVHSATLRDSFSGDGIDVLVINKDGSREIIQKFD